jgi:hypothetical protein
VTFLGADVTYNERGRDAVRDYLNRVAPEKVLDIDRIFAILADGEAKWPLRVDPATRAAIDHILPALDDLIHWLDDRRDDLVSRSSTR